MSRTLPHDPRLPQLAQALDGAAMAPVFARWLDAPPLACEVERVKYRPRRNLAVSYRLRLASGALQRVATRFCADGDAARRHAKALSQESRAGARGATVVAAPGVTLEPALDLVAFWWPHDPKLVAARALADIHALHARWLPEVAQALQGPQAGLHDAAVELVQVVPEHRLTARARLVLADGSAHDVYAKSDAEGRGAATHALMQALQASPAQRRGDLVTPRPLLWQADSALHWQQALPGRALLDLAPQVDAATAAQVGALVAALHGVPVPGLRALGLDDSAQRLREVAQTLTLVEARWAPRVMALAERLAPQLQAWHAAPAVTLHGDLHPRNLLRADDGRLGLIDLDSARCGPAVLDLAAWTADALYRAILADRPPQDALPALHTFVEAHAAASRRRVAEPLLAAATTYQLLCQRAWRCVVNLKPGRYERVDALLALAGRLLDAGHLDALADRREVLA